jgi:hypothetical protein
MELQLKYFKESTSNAKIHQYTAKNLDFSPFLAGKMQNVPWTPSDNISDAKLKERYNTSTFYL